MLSGLKTGRAGVLGATAILAGLWVGAGQAAPITYTLTPSEDSSITFGPDQSLDPGDPHNRITITPNWQPFHVTVDPGQDYAVTAVEGFDPFSITFDNSTPSGWVLPGVEWYLAEFSVNLVLDEAPFAAWEGTHAVNGILGYYVGWGFFGSWPTSVSAVIWTDTLSLGSIDEGNYLHMAFSNSWIRPQGENWVQASQFEGRSVIASEVPEPGVLTLFGAGLLALGFLRRRKA